jgi:hypothetical protein
MTNALNTLAVACFIAPPANMTKQQIAAFENDATWKPTTEQVEALMTEARAAGDVHQVHVCELALDIFAYSIDCNARESALEDIKATMTSAYLMSIEP